MKAARVISKGCKVAQDVGRSMNTSGILRLVALFCLLVIGFHGTVVYAVEDSVTAEPSTTPRTFTEPSTLRDLLDLLGKLNESDIKAQIVKEVEDRIKDYLKPPGIFRKGIKRNVRRVLRGIVEFRKKILKDPDLYGNYSRFNPCEDSVDYYVNVLIKWLPVLHSELWFLHFQISWEARDIGGGWRAGQRFGMSYYTTQLHRWLTDQLDRTTVPYIPKGFSPGALNESNRGLHIASNTGISLYLGGGPLNHAQYGLFFLSPTWHDSNLASAVRFLQEFCRQVNGKKFDIHASDANIESLKAVCKVLSMGFASLTDILHPLSRISFIVNPYKDKLKAKYFPKYADWLGRNLAGMIDSLRRMSSKMSRWTRDSLYNCEYSGPFRYGFVFRYQWTGQSSSIKDNLPPVIKSLTASDTGLLSKLYQLLTARPAQPGRLAHVPSQTVHFQSLIANGPSTSAGTYTLRDLLDILGILGGTVIKAQINKEVQHKIQAVLNLGGVPDETVEGILTGLIESIPDLRKLLLKDPHKYGEFTLFDPYEDPIAYYVDILVQWLPILHSEMWFLYYQTAEECITIGGGAWRNQRFGQSHGTTQLHRWLVSKGFKPDELHDDNRGCDISAKTGIYLNEGGLLSYAQYGLFFLSPTWHDSNLASAVRFLQEFCQVIHEDKFKQRLSDEMYTAVKSVCKVLSMGFAFLTDTLHPLYDGSMDTYRGKLKPGAYFKYVDWLGRNLGSLKGSLNQMLSESSEWTRNVFNKAVSLGPFKYGFVFKDYEWRNTLYYTLPPVIASLTGQASMPPSGIRQCSTSKASS